VRLVSGTPMNPIRAAIVGAGLMGRWHAHAAQRAGGHVVGIVDIDESAAVRLSKRFRDAAPFTTIEQMLVQSKPAVVHICSPMPTHYSMAWAAIDAGCHALVEKPMTSTAVEAERLLGFAASRGVYLNPVHQFVFQDGVRRAEQLLPRIGRLVDISAVIASAGGVGLSTAALDRLLIDVLPHPLSLVQFFLPGRIGQVSWTRVSPAFGELRLLGEIDGVSLSIFISFNARPAVNVLELKGTNGTIFINLFHGYSFFQAGEVSRARKLINPFLRSFKECTSASGNLGRRFLKHEQAYPGLRRLVQLFYRAVENRTPPPIERGDIAELARARDELMSLGATVLQRASTESATL